MAGGDFSGDGVLGLVAASGPGAMNLVRVLDGRTGATLFEVRPFGDSFFGGVNLAAGDITGDGAPDLVLGADVGGGPPDLVLGADVGGGPRVRVLQGGDYAVVADFYAIDDLAFRGGARVAVGGVNGDGRADIVAAPGSGQGGRPGVYPVQFVGADPAAGLRSTRTPV